jgi:hypothetical protein
MRNIREAIKMHSELIDYIDAVFEQLIDRQTGNWSIEEVSYEDEEAVEIYYRNIVVKDSVQHVISIPLDVLERGIDAVKEWFDEQNPQKKTNNP